MMLPDFFVIGAARSATTSLHYYLQQHPSRDDRERDSPSRRFGHEHDREPERPAEHVGSSVAEHQALPQVVPQECDQASGDDERPSEPRVGARDRSDRDRGDQARLADPARRTVEQVGQVGRERHQCRIDEQARG